MTKFYSVVVIVGAAVLLLGYQNCGPQSKDIPNSGQSASPLQVNGTVKALNLDGCNFVVQGTTAAGEAIQVVPLNLDPSYLNDGQAVSISGTLRTDLESTCQAGPLFQVDSAQ